MNNFSNSKNKVISKHPVGPFGTLYVIIGIILLFISITAIYHNKNIDHKMISTLLSIITIICVIIGLFILYRWYKYKNSIITVYTNGFECYLSSIKHSYNWNEIDYIIQRTEKSVNQGIVTPENTIIKVKIKNGPKYKFSQNLYQGIKDLATNIQQQMLLDRLPQDINKIKNGEVINYGILKLSKNGINRFYKKISWDEIATIEAVDDRVIITEKHRNKIWSRPYLFQLKNPYVFIELSKNLINSQH